LGPGFASATVLLLFAKMSYSADRSMYGIKNTFSE